MPNIAAAIQEMIDELRECQGVPYTAIAGLLGVHVRTLRRWAAGEVTPDATVLWRLYVLTKLHEAINAADLRW